MKPSSLSRARRLCAVAALACATALTAAAVPAQAAASQSQTAQGGCNEYTVGSTGFEIGVCINDRGTGTTAYPDIYVNKVGAHTGSCSIGIELWDNNNHHYGTTAQASCGKGHHTGDAYGPVSSTTEIHAFARLHANGTSYYFGGTKGDSPTIDLAPPSSATYSTVVKGTVSFDAAQVTDPSRLGSVLPALRHCRAEIIPSWLMKRVKVGFTYVDYPIALRLGMNQCLRDHIAVGVIVDAELVNLINKFLPTGPFPQVVDVITTYLHSISGQVGYWASTCGKLGYLFVQWQPARGAWLSCNAGDWKTL